MVVQVVARCCKVVAKTFQVVARGMLWLVVAVSHNIHWVFLMDVHHRDFKLSALLCPHSFLGEKNRHCILMSFIDWFDK